MAGEEQRANAGWVKVLFELEQDGDGYPPAGGETVWARRVSDGRYALDNIPFFARLVSLGDVVAADPMPNGTLVFRAVVRSAGHSTVRVLVADPADVPALRAGLGGLGCASELSHISRLLAVDVPLAVDYRTVRALLRDGERQGRWDYEESCLASHVPDD